MALLLLMLVAGPPGASGAMEDKGMEDSAMWCVCYQQLNSSEYFPCRLEGNGCLGSLHIWEKITSGREKNCTYGDKAQNFQTINASLKNDIPDCGGDNGTTISLIADERISFVIVITILTSSAGMLLLILLSVGISSMMLKKWRNTRLFKKQERWDNFLFKSKDVDYRSDVIYSNVINLVVQKEDDFAIYANMPCFQCPRKTSLVVTYAPDQMDHASVVDRKTILE